MATLPLLRPSVLRHPINPLHRKLHPPPPHSTHLKFPQPSKPVTSPMSVSASSKTPTPAADRLMSAASYCYPLFNGFQYGRFLLSEYPILATPFKPIIPVVSAYHSIPYASFISFFAFYLGIVRNPNVSRYVRFNALQALVLDVVLVVPMMVQQILSPGLNLTILGYNCLFVFLVACFAYALGCSVLGKTPYLPFIAEAASRQLDYS
nr:protein TIC 20-II, chloroplastic-like [Coffea arabica]XP_027087926.1 protein TIC 20-II, chloroplastic-like [Coffea arabica]